MKPEAKGVAPAGDTAFEDVVARVRREAAELEAAAYPGDLVEDIRSRLGTGASGSRLKGSPWYLVTAAAAALLAIIVSQQGPRLEPRVTPSAAPPVSLSGLARLPSLAAATVPRTLSPGATGMGRAFSIGSAATTQVRPPTRPKAKKEER
jgi:hypothetical protein